MGRVGRYAPTHPPPGRDGGAAEAREPRSMPTDRAPLAGGGVAAGGEQMGVC